MEMLGSLRGQKFDCDGKITMSGRSMYVDCRQCAGRSRLEAKECFNGLSERMIPGFSGNIVLMASMDRMYDGPAVEALVTISEVKDDVKTLEEGGGLAALSMKERKAAKRVISDILSRMEEDPYLLIISEKDLRKKISSISKGSSPVIEALEGVLEAVLRAGRRLEAVKETPG